MVVRFLLLVILYCLSPLTARAAAPVSCEECMALEKLPPELRRKSEELLLKALDSEALYTFIGGVKPMSSGMASFTFSVNNPDLKDLEEARQAIAAWKCGDSIFATIFSFHQIYEGKRTSDLTVIQPERFSQMLARYSKFFSPFGLSSSAHPLEALIMIENDPTVARLEGLGYFFGYPEYAVRWFADAETHRRDTGEFVERDFRSFETFARSERGVVWAVAKGAEERPEDRQFAATVEPILAAYRERRSRYIGDGKPGPAALLRDWYRGSDGMCSIEFALAP